MIDRDVWDSRHKFVYYDYETKDRFIDLDCVYKAELNSSNPIVISIYDEGLPNVDTTLELDKEIIKSFHNRYYELLIFLEIINHITNYIDNNELNKRLKRVFRLCSDIEIDDIRIFRSLLIDSKYMYRDAYASYMESGKLDFYDKVPIPFIMMDSVIPMIKDAFGLEKYFSILIDLDKDKTIYDCMAINNYIASRCNGYLSINVMLDKYDNWKSYYSSNGQLIQSIHDYTEVDCTYNKTRSKNI